MADQGGQDGTVQSVDRALRILALLSTSDSLGVSEISRELDVHRSTAFRLLATLEAHDYVEQESHRGTYRLAFGVLRLSQQVASRTDLAKEAQATCDAATAEVNETSNVAILTQGIAVNVTQTTGNRFVSVSQQYVGQQSPLHATSTGKVLLAHDPAELRTVLAGELTSFTANTITDADALVAQLDAVRERGWSSAVQEWELEMNAVAVPVRDLSGRVVAALAVTAPSFRMPESEFPAFADVLVRHAQRLSARLGATR
ncbi:IclR family transcriptional regulator [Pseudoclavibacter chungangensis]|uniref:Glycerol operon regulatory protein n=1 Tax=Pseudoclavibacter chungangensis TaxID=587635 RepID=A0A7J5BSX5_9MICO|nr:IclR family transcriptional regulator [Pseudoclavibacter chungangensis]KAB1656657.1 IclR family transcriptional regulator [Pseudoclavibacter chungangensis]NYJ67895.1 DNA-binding IclR family transcriptional regulator [Pseudoclavibacter chungangensis]